MHIYIYVCIYTYIYVHSLITIVIKISASPFRMSSEWTNLKEGMKVEKVRTYIYINMNMLNPGYIYEYMDVYVAYIDVNKCICVCHLNRLI
jgi:formate hydrogenlyase subunit 4